MVLAQAAVGGLTQAAEALEEGKRSNDERVRIAGCERKRGARSENKYYYPLSCESSENELTSTVTFASISNYLPLIDEDSLVKFAMQN